MDILELCVFSVDDICETRVSLSPQVNHSFATSANMNEQWRIVWQTARRRAMVKTMHAIEKRAKFSDVMGRGW